MIMKTAIPKERLRRMIEAYGCSEEEAAKAYLNAKDRADEAVTAFLKERFGLEEDTASGFEPKAYTPKEIKCHLDKYVVSQEDYKKRLAIAAAYHFTMIKYLTEHPEDASVKRLRKKNTVIAGPPGSGKTYCVEVLGDLLQVPTLIVDATDYTEAGYVGKSADDMIRELSDLAPGKSREERARFIGKYGGMIFIDEIDKKAKDGTVVGLDISREGFQRSVLKLIERKLVSIHSPLSSAYQVQEMMDGRTGIGAKKRGNVISSENVLFILGGSFERPSGGLDAIVRKRLQHKGRVAEDGSIEIKGFTGDEKTNEKDQLQSYYKQAEADDFIRFGLLPELIGRSPIRTFVNLLSKNDLIRIMEETEDSILHQYKLEFSLFNVDVQFTQESVEYVAEIAENRKTGARALVSVWENILTDFQFELPGSSFARLEVTRKLCERPRDILLRMLERSPFADFAQNFRKEYGIEIVWEENVPEYVEEYARQHNMQVSEVLKKLLLGASALNYMGAQGPYRITIEMLRDKRYFDKLFASWYENRKTKIRTELTETRT